MAKGVRIVRGSPAPSAARTAVVCGTLAMAAWLSAAAASPTTKVAATGRAGGDDGLPCAAATVANCDGVRKRAVCASDGRTYASACELQRLNRCEGRGLTAVDCASQAPPPPATRAEDRCTASLKNEFAANFLKHVQENFDRLAASDVHSLSGSTWSEKVVNWKFDSLDADGSERLSAAELRQFKRLVRNNLHPRACSKDLSDVCDNDQDADISRHEWFACFGLRTSTSSAASREEMQADMQSPDGRSKATAASDEALRIAEEPGLMEPPVPVGRRASNPFLLHGSGLLPGDSPTHQQRRHRDDPDGKRARSSSDDLVSIAVRTCTDARESALRHPSNGAIQKPVPVCQKNGKFQREQCLPRGHICWCADEDSGSPILGSMVYAGPAQLNCSEASAPKRSGGASAGKDGGSDTAAGNQPQPPSSSQPPRERELPGCANKKSFLEEVVSTFTREMTSSGKGSAHAPDASWTAAEKALHWKVAQCDRNSDKRLSPSEARELLRALTVSHGRLSAKPQLGRCTSGFLVYCDANGDKHLTYAELADCLELREPLPPSPASEHSSTLGRPGWPKRVALPIALDLNPFVHLLVPLSHGGD